MIWAEIDARGEGGEVTPGERVAGMPMVARHVRLAARQRWAGARILVQNAARRSEVERALAAKAPPPGFPVEIVELAQGSTSPVTAFARTIPLDACAVYTADALRAAGATDGVSPEPLVTIRRRADVRTAENKLYGALRKSMWEDGFVAFYVLRRLSVPMSKLLVGTPVTPNQVTLVAMACGVAAAIAASFGGYAATVLAGFLFFAGATIDCVDGELARLRVEGSKLGEWLDSSADDISTFGLLAGLGVGMWRDGASETWLWFAIVGAVVGLLTQVFLYLDLWRMKMPIDTAQYPWFFGKPTSGATTQSSALGRAFSFVTLLFRRDCFVVIILGLLVAGRRDVAAVLLCGGGLLVTGLVLVHYAVRAIRR